MNITLVLGTESLTKNILHYCSKHAACKNNLLDQFTVHIMESLTEKYYCTNVDVKIYGYFDIYKPSLSDYVNLEIFYKSFHNKLETFNRQTLFCLS